MDIKYTFCLRNQIKLLILLTLFAATASASTLKRLDSLRLAALARAGIDSVTNQMSLISANRAVNTAIQWTSANFPAVKKAGVDTCSSGVVSYAIGDTTFSRLIWCLIWREQPPEGKQNLAVLKVVPADSVYEYVEEGKPLPETEEPLAYAYAWAGSLHVSPAPVYEDILMYGYLAIGLSLLADDSTTDIHPSYRELIVDHAAYLIREELGLEKAKE